MIEQAMYFALGFLVAGLFSLMFLPALWRRAMRLSQRRLQMLAPFSQEEAAAERDLLRAEFAASYRRLEQQMAAVKAGKAQDLVEIGRHAARIAELNDELTAAQAHGREVERQLRETQGLLSERTELLNVTEAALIEMTERAERDIAARRDPSQLGRQAEPERKRAAAHEAKIGALHAQNVGLRQEVDKLKAELARAATQSSRLADADAALSETARRLDAAIAEKLELQRIFDAECARLAELDNRHLGEIRNLEATLEIARVDESGGHFAARSNAMLESAIDTLRKQHALLREARAKAEAASHGAGSVEAPFAVPASASGDGEAKIEQDIIALREAITEIGARMAESSAPAAAKSGAPKAAAAKRAR